MSSESPAGERGRRRWQGLCAVAVALAPFDAQADLWLIESSVGTSLESNDNIALAQESSGTVNSLSITASLDASRQLENSATRLKTDVTAVRQYGPGAQNRLDGRLALSQALSDPLNTFNLSLQYAQDFNNVVANADVTQGQGQRRTTTASGLWSRALTERLGANTQLSVDQTRYGHALSSAVDYRDASASVGLSYGLDEATSLGLQTSVSAYRPVDASNPSKTGRLSVSLSRPYAERSSASLSFGIYRTTSAGQRSRLVCPLAQSLCDGGLVPRSVVTESVESARRGLEFSASNRHQFSEIMDGALSVSRQQVPSGAGALVRSDTVSAALNRSLSETLRASATFARSRSAFQEAALTPQPGQSTLAMSLSRQLTPNLSLQAGYQHSRADQSSAGHSARSNSVTVSLKYDGLRLDASR